MLGGTGPAGKALAARLASVGFDVVIGSRSLERASEAAEDLVESWPGHRFALEGDRQRLEGRVKAQHVAGHDRHAGGGAGINHLLRVVDIECDGLFDQHMLARRDRPERELRVELRGQGEHDRIDIPVLQDLFNLPRRNAELPGERLGTGGIRRIVQSNRATFYCGTRQR